MRPIGLSLLSRWVCLLLVSGWVPATASACTCSDLSLEQDFKEADLVFHGRFMGAEEVIDLGSSWEQSFPMQPWHDWVSLGENPTWQRVFPGFVRVDQQENRFHVLGVYKGTVGQSIDILSPPRSMAGYCNYLFFFHDQDYIVFARSRGWGYETSACMHTGPIADLSERVSRLGPARPPPLQTPATVAMELLSGLVLLWLGWFLHKRRPRAPAAPVLRQP